jgi:hypothetical protein
MVEDFGSMIPSSLWDGMLWEKRRKASAGGAKGFDSQKHRNFSLAVT